MVLQTTDLIFQATLSLFFPILLCPSLSSRIIFCSLN